jgi:hypothetical protein
MKKPLLNQWIAAFLWIIVLGFWFVPSDIISYLKRVLIELPILFLIFLDIYNPLEENRNPFLWKLRVIFWGDPNIKNQFDVEKNIENHQPENIKINFVHDLIDPGTGISYKEGNLKKTHNIPLRTLVEVVNTDPEYHHQSEGLRVYVVEHERDADGTPMYSLSIIKDWEPYTGSNEVVEMYRNGQVDRGYSENMLKVIL